MEEGEVRYDSRWSIRERRVEKLVLVWCFVEVVRGERGRRGRGLGKGDVLYLINNQVNEPDILTSYMSIAPSMLESCASMWVSCRSILSWKLKWTGPPVCLFNIVSLGMVSWGLVLASRLKNEGSDFVVF